LEEAEQALQVKLECLLRTAHGEIIIKSLETVSGFIQDGASFDEREPINFAQRREREESRLSLQHVHGIARRTGLSTALPDLWPVRFASGCKFPPLVASH